MALSWGELWGDSWGVSWGQAGVEPPAPPPSEVTPAGWNAYVREAQKKKRRHKLPLSEENELIHPEVPEPIHADDSPPKEVLSAEKFAELKTHGLRRPLSQVKAHDEDEEDAELLLLTI